MKNQLLYCRVRLYSFLFVSLLSFKELNAQTETLSTGSFIINMGATNPNTIANGLKPYGLIYDLIRNYNVAVKCIISQTKVKDGADFIYNSVLYKGGTFIIPAEYRSVAVNSRITFWTGQGVVGTTTTSPLTVDVSYTQKSYPKWTLDAQNGAIAQSYLTNAGITLAAFPGAYNWKSPQTLDCCDDFFVMPHADPTWATHSNLLAWNQNCLGSIWAACHAVSALENMVNPANRNQQTNFLTVKDPAYTGVSGNYANSNSLMLWTTHAGGSVPYTHLLPGLPVSQYLGSTDAAQLNGSEQIYIPRQGALSRWNPGVTIIAYDPSQVNVAALNPDLRNAAVVMVYGRGFDDPTRGYVMYEAAHTHNNGTAGDIAAQRAFLNFSFFQITPKVPQLTVTGITVGQQIPVNTTITGLNVIATSPLSGITFTYQWSSTCGGSFSNPTGATTNFTAPGSSGACVITCTVTDNCGRVSFNSYPITILPPAAPPVANPDVASINATCGSGTAITVNVLSNDTDPRGLPLTLTNVTGAVNGTVSYTTAGNITFTPNANFTGPLVLNYTVCNNTTPVPLCANSTLTISVTGVSTPATANDAFTIAEDAIGRFNVLANDAPGLTVIGITTGPTNGKVSINTDNTITYVPNADFGGPTDIFTYRVTNGTGGYNTAIVTVTVINDACDGGTMQTGSATPVPVSGNNWTQVGTNTTGGNAASSTWSYPIGAGSNRVLVVAVEVSVNAANLVPTTKTVTWGGKPLTFLATNPSTGNRVFAYLYYLKESDIAAASGNNLVVSMGGATTPVYGFVTFAAVYQDVDQTTIVRNGVNLVSSITTSTTATLSTADFTAGDQGIFIAGFGLNSATSTAYSSTVSGWTGSSGLFAGGTANGGSFYGGVATRNATTAATNETTSMTVTVAQRTSMSVVSLIPSGTSCVPIPNRAPMAMPDTATTPNGIAVNIGTATNDFFPIAGALTYSILATPASGIAIINGSGVVNYTPATSFNGVRTLTYTVTHTGSGLVDTASVYINITNGQIDAVDDTPLPGSNSGVVQTINVKGNDTDPEGLVATATVAITTAPLNGSATVDGSGNIVYTPNVGFTGKDTLFYSLCEPAPSCGSPLCDTARVIITVLNRVPTANPDNKTILPCNANTINLIANDTDPENGILSVNFISALSNTAAGTLVNNNDGTVTFTPAPGFLGVVTFTYTVIDNGVTPQTSAPALVSITVSNPVNTAPVAGNDYETTPMDQVVYSSVLDNDSDPENQNLTNPVIMVAPLHGTAVVLANGLVKYTPNAGYFGNDSLTYQICDMVINPVSCTQLPSLCTTAKLYITITVPNTTNAVNDENSTWINTAVSGGVMVNDYDLEHDGLVFTGFIDGSGIAHTSGTITVSGVDVNGNAIANAGTLTINSNGTYTYTPALNFIGVIAVPYTISDNNINPANDTAYLKITVNPLQAVSNSVIANNDENISYGNPVSDNVLLNDRDPQGNTFSVTTFKYDTDGDGTPDGTGTVGTPVIIGGQTTTGLATSNAGTLVLNANGSYTFTPASDFHGSIDVPYTICDNGIPVACATAILHIDVLPDINGPLNDPPFAGDDFNYTTFNTPVSGNFSNNDSDPNGNPISVNGITINTGGPHTLINTLPTVQGGIVTFYSDGTYTYNPPSGYTGPDYVNYTICDVTVVAPQPLCANAQIHFLIPPTSTLPVTGLQATASLQGIVATIKWETLSEQNSDYFTLERSLDNILFTATGSRVNAAGNSSSKTKYQQDDNISSLNQYAVIYYRVKLTDIDGRIKYSTVVAVRLSKTTGITAWPNPFSSSITVNISAVQNTALTIRLTDVAGRTVLTRQQQAARGVTQLTINNLEILSNGVYLLDIADDMLGNKTVMKFIKEK